MIFFLKIFCAELDTKGLFDEKRSKKMPQNFLTITVVLTFQEQHFFWKILFVP